jgi:hypothetical protein
MGAISGPSGDRRMEHGSSKVALCAVCAWRGFCQKRFRAQSGLELRCPDFARDVSLPEEQAAGDEAGGGDCRES